MTPALLTAAHRSCSTSYRAAWPVTSTSSTRRSSSNPRRTPRTRRACTDRLLAGELPVPRLVRSAPAGHRPRRVEPVELRRVVEQPQVLRRVVDLDAAA